MSDIPAIKVTLGNGKIGGGSLNSADYNSKLPAAQAFDGLPVTFIACTDETSAEETLTHLMAALTNSQYGSEIDNTTGTDYAVFAITVKDGSKNLVMPGDVIRVDQGNLEATFMQHASNVTEDNDWDQFVVRYNFKQ